MSLRAFHLLFIGLSVVLTVFFALWAVGQYRLMHQATYMLTGVASAVSGAALVFYGAAFQRKTRRF
jgi:uncharacterized membrane protein YadS